MDISSLSLNELRRLQTKVEAEIRRRSDTAKKDLLKRMQKLAAEHGMSLNEVLGQEASEKPAAAPKKAAAAKPVKKAAKPVSVVKFRHPENPAIGWTGHGRKPQWVIDWLAQGKALDELRADAAALTAA
ncbi:MAG: H-NS histone family protein [Zoogloea sp.]|jgi:DNA-binding protein H-NS|nr:H-NS histone family protein [Zoogloea sp.]MBP6636206.1 H-NS histone family protein [Sulfuritalea sp.]MBP7393702.1 H-NS histone family protein [Zoogloea sp.]